MPIVLRGSDIAVRLTSVPAVAFGQAGLLSASFDQEAFHLGAKRSFKFVLPNSNDAPAAAAQFA